jgi:intracellular septation protein
MSAPVRRLFLDLGPLVLFFITFRYFGIFTATGVFMAAVLVALVLEYTIEKRLSPMLIFTAILVLVFGGLTLYLKNDVFIKMKPTVLYAFFGITLIGGLAFDRLFIKYVFAQAFEMDQSGWRQLTWRWGVFFLVLAILNEAVWRTTSTATWVAFKVWGFAPLIFLFALAQTPLVMKHHVEQEKPATD